ncbi:MAG TPA: hypothetical protein VHO06_18670 [Polyangia bacterium]|nr:hypothetical protein [Polyangia bacterium]
MRRPALLLLAAALGAGCGGASPESGVTAWMRIAGAQFVAGPLTAGTCSAASDAGEGPDAGSPCPLVRQVALMTNQVAPGQENVPVSGSVEKGSAVLVGLSGDSGHWIVPTTVADVSLADNYDFSAQLTFSPLTPAGPHQLIFRPVAPDGTLGPTQVYPLAVAPPTPAGAPQLLVQLTWDTESDLDLHVDVPDPDDPTTPIEIWYKAPVGLPIQKPGDPPPTPDQVAAAGYLDFDSNAACAIDGRRQENVIFTMPPPAGTYTVRVDANSLCGQPDAQWQVTATDAAGDQLGFAQWEATDADTRGAHGVGAGRLAFTFDIPSP